MSNLREAHRREFISKVPHFNSFSNYLDNPELTPIANSLISRNSLLLKAVETNFAPSASRKNLDMIASIGGT